MKKTLIYVAVIAIAGATITGCKSKQQVPTGPTAEQMRAEAELIRAQQELANARAAAEQADRQRAAEAAIGEDMAIRQAARLAATTEMPCQIYDCAQWYTAVGERRVHANAINTAATALLRSTQQQLRQKLQGQYRAVVRDYMDQMDVDENSSVAAHIESAGDYVINQKMNETEEVCRRNTERDAQGYMTMYMAIRVSKKAIVDEVVNRLSNDQRMEVRFNEDQFRKSAFKVFEQDQRNSYQDYESNRTSQ